MALRAQETKERAMSDKNTLSEAKAEACAAFLRERVGSPGYAHTFAKGWEAAAERLIADHTDSEGTWYEERDRLQAEVRRLGRLVVWANDELRSRDAETPTESTPERPVGAESEQES
jgi:hypothetical protein